MATELVRAGECARIFAPMHINSYAGELPPGLVRGRRLARVGRAARAVSIAAAVPMINAFRPDILHQTYFARVRGVPGRARLVLTVYDMIHEKFPQMFPRTDLTAVLKKAAIARADHIICISESTRRDLVDAYPLAGPKSSVTLLGFDHAGGVPPGPRRGRPYLLHVGQRGGYKNWSALLGAYASSPALRAEFDLLAVGGGSFSEAEQAEIAALGVTAGVRHDAVDDSSLMRCYSHAAVFVYPSLYEGFGIPPLEAMAAATPVVAVRAGSVPEVCGNAAAYADGGTVESLRAAIEAVAFSPTLAAQLVAAGNARLQRFSWKRCAAETASIYRALL